MADKYVYYPATGRSVGGRRGWFTDGSILFESRVSWARFVVHHWEHYVPGRCRSSAVFADRFVLAIVFVSASVVALFLRFVLCFFVASFTTARSLFGPSTYALGRQARQVAVWATSRAALEGATLQRALEGAPLSPVSRIDPWIHLASQILPPKRHSMLGARSGRRTTRALSVCTYQRPRRSAMD